MNNLPVKQDADGNTVLEFDKGLHLVIDGDFEITANGEVSVLSKTAITLDCALMLLNCRMAKQIRKVKEEMRLDFIETLGGFPDMTPSQLEYVKVAKQKIRDVLHLDEKELSHIKEKTDE